MPRGRKKVTEAVNENVGQGKPIDLGEIGEGQPIEPVSENDFVEEANVESFMNDILTVMVHPDQMDGSLDTAPVMVNGLNQHFIRGMEQQVKRKYVEALARTRTTVYDNKQDMTAPDKITYPSRTTLTYPFAVTDDPHPNGREWLMAILNEK